MAKILIVDDERDLAEVLKETLEYEGFEVEILHRGEEAIQRFNQPSIDAIIVDLRLEGNISGIDVVRHFVGKPSRPKILVSSGTPRSMIKTIFEKEGIANLIDAVLEKPGDLNPDFVASSVRKVLNL